MRLHPHFYSIYSDKDIPSWIIASIEVISGFLWVLHRICMVEFTMPVLISHCHIYSVLRGLNGSVYFCVYIVIEYVCNDEFLSFHMLRWMADLTLI